MGYQEELLPAIRIGGLWIWALTLLVTANWARRMYGPRAMAMASALFALSPNLLAHGILSTMELPLLACSTAMFFGFWCFLRGGRRRDFRLTAALGGLAISCKFTTIIIPPILALVWGMDLWLRQRPDGEPPPGPFARLRSIARTVVPNMVAFLAIMAVSNLVITGFSTLPLERPRGLAPDPARQAVADDRAMGGPGLRGVIPAGLGRPGDPDRPHRGTAGRAT